MTRHAWIGLGLLLAFCAPCRSQTFTNVTAATGIAVPALSVWNGHGRGHCWADFDGDGDLDLFAPGGAGHGIKLWWNVGGVFTPQIIDSGAGPIRNDHGCVAADFDNDGDQDVYLCQGNWLPDRLYVNNGSGVFTNQAWLRGITHLGDTYAASWGDFDRDGWLDLYVGNLSLSATNPIAYPNHILYRNNGNGTFTDVTSVAGAASPSATLAVLWHDYDQDGWPDIHIGNDRGNQGGPPNALLRNNRNGTFTNVAQSLYANAPIGCMGITVADLHNDGDWDVFLTNTQQGHVLLEWDPVNQSYLHPGGWFAVATSYGLQTNQIGWGCSFFDYDLDGWNDLFIAHSSGPNRLFKGNGAAAFTDDTFLRGINTALPPVQSSSVVDYDDDGDLDIWVPGDVVPSQMARNPSADDGTKNWLKVKLQGTVSNRDALGAVVIARSASATQRRMRVSGEGYLSDNDPRLHFGLGGDTAASLEVRWPSGTVSWLSGVASNQIVTVVEPKWTLAGALTPGSVNVASTGLPDDVGQPYVAAITVDVFSQHGLGDGRFLRFNLADPVAAVTVVPGNPWFFPPIGTLNPVTGVANILLALPSVPQATGFPFWLIGVSVDPSLPGAIKSIVGPQRFTIQ